MAYTLKNTGISTNATMVLAVNSDGTTITEFVSSAVDAAKTVDAGVTTGSATWKGTSRGLFSTDLNKNIHFGATKPPCDTRLNPLSVFVAVAGMSAGDGVHTPAIIDRNGTAGALIQRGGLTTGPLQSGVDSISGSTNMPTDNTTKFSVGMVHNYLGTVRFFYGNEAGAGALVADGTGADGGSGAVESIFAVGTAANIGTQPGQYLVVATFNVELTLAQFQSLHGDGTNDWFSTLFNAPTGSDILFAQSIF